MLMHVLRRDLRRTRWLLAVTVLTLMTWCALPWAGYAQFDFGRRTDVLINLYLVMMFAHGAVTVALVRRLVVEDSPLREGAFWRTRPLRPGTVLAAKLIYGAVFAWALPTLATIPLGMRLPAEAFLVGLSNVAVAQGMIVWVALPVAMLSRRMLVGLASVVGTYVGLAVTGVGSKLINAVLSVSVYSRSGSALDFTRGWLALAILAGATGWAVWRTYARGEQRRGLVAVAGALAAGLLVQTWWPWALIPASWAAPGSADAKARNDAGKELAIELNQGGVPKKPGTLDYYHAGVVNVRRQAGDERLWTLDRVESFESDSAERRSIRFPRPMSGSSALGRVPALLAGSSLSEMTVLGGDRASFVVWVEGVSPAPVTKWSGRLFFEEGRLRELGVAAIGGAEAGGFGDRLRVVKSEVKTREVWVRAVDINPVSEPRGQSRLERTYALVNDKRGEVFVESPSGRDLSSFYVRCSEWSFTFDRQLWGDRDDVEVRAWLSGARLVRLTYAKEGRFYVDVGPVEAPVLR